jgi:succinate dehydrogenase hydrophobic anchor subunit
MYNAKKPRKQDHMQLTITITAVILILGVIAFFGWLIYGLIFG